MKDNTNTLTECINTEPRQTDITKKKKTDQTVKLILIIGQRQTNRTI